MLSKFLIDLDRDASELEEYLSQASPLTSFHQSALESLDYLGRKILSDVRAREFPDLVTYAFKCTRSAFYSSFSDEDSVQFGLGLVLHIAPGNIPMNFAYSLNFGILAGNANLIRLPSRKFPQVDLFLQILEEASDSKAGKFFESKVRFFRSDRDSQTITGLVANADGLVVWGGDATVDFFRSLKKKPSCREVFFPDRKSSAILHASSVAGLGESELDGLCQKFYNDTFLVDQNACSSPSTVVWVGDAKDVEAASMRFWAMFSHVIQLRYKTGSSIAIEKLSDLVSLVEHLGKAVPISRAGGLVWRFADFEAREGELRYGQFYEASSASLDLALQKLRGDEQTLTYFGFDKKALRQKLEGLSTLPDRITSVGSALDIGLVWDGKSMVPMLSKTVILD